MWVRHTVIDWLGIAAFKVFNICWFWTLIFYVFRLRFTKFREPGPRWLTLASSASVGWV
jgi:hypothetical protein